MKAQTLFLVASAICGAFAAPMQKRDPTITRVVYEDVVHVVTYTSTVYVKTSQPPQPLQVADEEKGNYGEKPVRTTTTTSPSVYKPEPEPTTSSTSTSIEIPEKPATDAPEPTTTKPTTTYVPPAPTTEAPYVAPTPSPEPQPKPQPKPEPQPEPEPEPENPGNGGSYGTSGIATWYDPGMGSCGGTHSGDELVVAISHFIMDDDKTGNPNTNPNCNRRIKCTHGDKSVTVKVVDTCMSCTRGHVDLTPAAFEALGVSKGAGKIPVKWEFLEDE